MTIALVLKSVTNGEDGLKLLEVIYRQPLCKFEACQSHQDSTPVHLVVLPLALVRVRRRDQLAHAVQQVVLPESVVVVLQVVLVDDNPVAELDSVDKLANVVWLSVYELCSVSVLDVILAQENNKDTIKNFSMNRSTGGTSF